MITIRKAKERGHFDFGWLDTYHTFSFDRYHDPNYMGFRTLRVINEDKVRARHGFPMHFHRDMEIITYILKGELAHRDSMGNGSIIRPGDVQRMTAGTGISHSESNPLESEEVHLLQIWILPQQRGLEPSYEQKFFSDDEKSNKLRLVASHDGRENSVTVHQDVSLYSSVLNHDSSLHHDLARNRFAWIQVARGTVVVNGDELSQGDGAAIREESAVDINAREASEILLFDLA